MRYIKLFEKVLVRIQSVEDEEDLSPSCLRLYKKMKFKFGDIVKVKDVTTNIKNNIFKITVVDVDSNEDNYSYSYYIEKYDNSDNFPHKGWRKGEELEKVEDFEIDANKYNI